MTKKKVIIDTDIGLDDATAICFLAKCKQLDIKAITLVAGNASVPIISKNLRRILSFIGRKDIKLYEAGSYNLLGKYIETDGYFGSNGFADIELPESNIKVETDMTSPQALIHYSRKYPGELNLICIGPLTNIALAFLLDNAFPSRLASITLMGSDCSEETLCNVTPYAEFNAHCDPAAYRVLASCFKDVPNPIVIVEWTCCRNFLLPLTMHDDFVNHQKSNNHSNKALELYNIVTDRSNDYIKRSYWENGFLTADLFAVVGFVYPNIFLKKRRVRLHVEVDGEKPGHTVYTDDPEGNFELITEVDVPEMARLMTQVLKSQ